MSRCYRPLALLALPVALFSAASLAAAEPVRYVSDELVIVVRDGASSEAPVIGSINSGTRLLLLESDAASGYGRVRLDSGREGWVQERYLTPRAPARQRADAAEKKLAQAESELKALREEHAKLLTEHERVSQGLPPAPPTEVAAELEQLRATVAQLRQQNEALSVAGGQSRERQRTLLLGGALVAGGFVLAWMIRWLWPRRRWGDL